MDVANQAAIPETSKAYRAWERDLNAALRDAVKGAAWRQKRGVVFQQIDRWFVAGRWVVEGRGADRQLIAHLMAKPMAIDPLLWDVMGLGENNDQPLSFRYWGAFVCGLPTLASAKIANGAAPATARAIVDALDAALPEALARMEAEPFSAIARAAIAANDRWRMEETLAFSHKLEENPELAETPTPRVLGRGERPIPRPEPGMLAPDGGTLLNADGVPAIELAFPGHDTVAKTVPRVSTRRKSAPDAREIDRSPPKQPPAGLLSRLLSRFRGSD
ncbi:MAG: hypothetical protein KI785_10105 [Devosiaceae bacterium]|nr:hypothetical protein [Devosiaceae bacterium MH13]